MNSKNDFSARSLPPALFIGHGSPMNAIAKNAFTQFLNSEGDLYRQIKGVIVISAHWVTSGTQVTKHVHNPLIYDFYGFPEELYRVKFESDGNIQLSETIANDINAQHSKLALPGNEPIALTEKWGLDHGAWTVLIHMFRSQPPFPIFQMSLNKNLKMEDHFRLAASLKDLRKKGFLILSSGNLVHNLRQISWNEEAPVFDWAIEFDEMIKKNLLERNFNALFHPEAAKQKLWTQAHPTLEHYIPLLYTIGLMEEGESLRFPHESFQNGSISMRSVKIGNDPA